MPKDAKAYELEGYGIEKLEDIEFSNEAEEVNLRNNRISNPGIVNELMKLPHLKALWLNGNDVVTNCHNFEVLAAAFDQLEILNSRFTEKAGEWALLFCAREQEGVKALEDIVNLDLSARGPLRMSDM